MKHLARLFAIFTLLPATLIAQQPLAESAKLEVTDAPVLGRGVVEMEFGYQFARVHDVAGDPAHSSGTAAYALAYGVTDRLDLFAGLCWCERHRQGAALESGSGIGDGVAGLKYQFLATSDDVWSMSALTALQFPLGVSFGVGGLRPGSDAWSVSPGITASMNQRRFSVTGHVAGVLPIEASEGNAMVMLSAAAGYQIHPRIQPVLEVAHITGMEGAAASPSWSGGVVLSLTDYLRLTAGLRNHNPSDTDGHERCGFFRMTVAM